MTDYMHANAAAKHVGITDPRSIVKRVEPDGWHVNVSSRRVPLFTLETLDVHAEELRRAVRPGYHGRIDRKLSSRVSERNVQPERLREPGSGPSGGPPPERATGDLSAVVKRIDYALTRSGLLTHKDQIVAMLLLARAGSLSSADLPFAARVALDELVDQGLAAKAQNTYAMVLWD